MKAKRFGDRTGADFSDADEQEVSSAKPAPQREYAVAQDLVKGLCVREDGRHRWYLFRYRLQGRRTRISIGPVDKVALNQAVSEAQRYAAWVAAGNDPRDMRELGKPVKPRRSAKKSTMRQQDQIVHSVAEVRADHRNLMAVIEAMRSERRHLTDLLGDILSELRQLRQDLGRQGTSLLTDQSA